MLFWHVLVSCSLPLYSREVVNSSLAFFWYQPTPAINTGSSVLPGFLLGKQLSDAVAA